MKTENICPTWLKFLSESVGDAAAIELIRSFMRAHLSNERFGKALYLSGSGRCGRTVLINVLTALSVAEFAEYFEFKDLGHRFQLARLRRKDDLRSVLVVIDEPPFASSDATNSFKSILAGDPIEAEYRFQGPFVFTPLVNFIFHCNTSPGVMADPSAYGRIVVVQMRRPEHPNQQLTRELMAELDEIGRWVFQGVEHASTR